MKLGQHFLINREVLGAMVALVKEHGSKETILEIGAGKGVLTKELAHLAKRVIAVEIDKRFTPHLMEIAQHHPNVEIIFQDILRVDLARLGLENGHFSIAANLPYEITSIVLRNFLTKPPFPSNLALLIQREVAERLVAQPGKMSILGLSVQAFCQPRIIRFVPPSAFRPQPKVESAIVSLENVRAHVPFRSPHHEAGFFRLIKAGFAQRRKLLRSNLKHHFKISTNELENALTELELPQTTRAQELSLNQWLALVDKLIKFLV